MSEKQSDRTQKHLQAEYVVAEAVRQQLQTFPRKFRELGAGGELRELLRKTRTLSGPQVKQAPEDFTEQYLIEPVLHGMGYLNPTSEEYEGGNPHFVRRPTTFRKVEPKRPDYLLKNIDPSIVCILEAKAANNEQLDGRKRKASADIEQYLEEDTFCRYLRDLETQYLVGIGTDGLRWRLWAKNLETGEVATDTPVADISGVIERCAIREDVIEGELEDESRSADRDLLYESLVPYFAERTICEHISNLFR